MTDDPLTICQKWMAHAHKADKKPELRALWAIYDIIMGDLAGALTPARIALAVDFLESIEPKTDAGLYEAQILKSALRNCGVEIKEKGEKR